jgi:hypothetical protein
MRRIRVDDLRQHCVLEYGVHDLPQVVGLAQGRLRHLARTAGTLALKQVFPVGDSYQTSPKPRYYAVSLAAEIRFDCESARCKIKLIRGSGRLAQALGG